MSKTKKISYRKRKGETLVDMEKIAERMGINKKGGMDSKLLRTALNDAENRLREADKKTMENMLKEVRKKRTEFGIRNEKKKDETDEEFKEYENKEFQKIWDEGMGSFVKPSKSRTYTDSAPSSGDFAREKGFPTKPFLTKDFFQMSMSLNIEDQNKVKEQIRSMTPEQNMAIATHLQRQLDERGGKKRRRRRTLKKRKTKRKSRKYRKRVKPMDIPE